MFFMAKNNVEEVVSLLAQKWGRGGGAYFKFWLIGVAFEGSFIGGGALI